ncbi:MAG: hemerythrin [Oxalobacter sp.]|jgi:hemerythrin-like metal-binding protein|nr:MAG: hemerythrin [Oxalobacter sp.]
MIAAWVGGEMALVRWDDKYLVGNPDVDHDHRTLFAMINEFHEAFQESKKRGELIVILRRLVDYSERHFQREEAIMSAAGYPALDEHHAAHEKLFETIFELNDKLESDPAPLDRQTIAFLRTWLSDHVIAQDLKLGAFLREKNGQKLESKPES